MIDKILAALLERGITLASPISLKNCILTRPYKLSRAGFDVERELTAIIFAVPYLAPHKKKNLSAYAICRDYHGYFAELFDSLIPMLSELYPENHFAGFADNSPIDERHAAASAGLGIIGDNGLLITEKYSSYVFLGEIITDIPTDVPPKAIEHCLGCGECKRVCPADEIGQCLSALTQKKGELSADEKNAIISFGLVWGCDICQEVCPYTKQAVEKYTIYTNIDYFKSDLLPILSSHTIDSMNDDELSRRAYSWRGRETIGRNIKILEDTSKSEK